MRTLLAVLAPIVVTGSLAAGLAFAEQYKPHAKPA
jgi:hypothetical protein